MTKQQPWTPDSRHLNLYENETAWGNLQNKNVLHLPWYYWQILLHNNLTCNDV